MSFGACNKDALPQDEEDAAVSVKGFAKLDPYDDGGGSEVAFNWNSITASDFAKGATPPFNNFQKELCGGITIFRTTDDVLNKPWTSIDDVTLGNGNDPVYLWFEQPEEGACEGDDGIFYLLVRYKASNNVAMAFHIKACIAWCASTGHPISLQCGDLWLYGGERDVNLQNLGPVTQVRLGGYEFVEAPRLPVQLKFYWKGGETVFHNDVVFEGEPLICAFYRAGSEGVYDGVTADYHPYEGEEPGDCNKYGWDEAAAWEFFKTEGCQWENDQHYWVVKGTKVHVKTDGNIDDYAEYIVDGVLELVPIFGDESCIDPNPGPFTVTFVDEDGNVIKTEEGIIKGDGVDCPDYNLGDCKVFIEWVYDETEYMEGGKFFCGGDGTLIFDNITVKAVVEDVVLNNTSKGHIDWAKGLLNTQQDCYTKASFDAYMELVSALANYNGCSDAEVSTLKGLIEKAILVPADADADFMVRFNAAFTKLAKPDCPGADWTAYEAAFNALVKFGAVTACNQGDAEVLLKEVEKYYEHTFTPDAGDATLQKDITDALDRFAGYEESCFTKAAWDAFVIAHNELLKYRLVTACNETAAKKALKDYEDAESVLMLSLLDNITEINGASVTDGNQFKIQMYYATSTSVCGGGMKPVKIQVGFWVNHDTGLHYLLAYDEDGNPHTLKYNGKFTGSGLDITSISYERPGFPSGNTLVKNGNKHDGEYFIFVKDLF